MGTWGYKAHESDGAQDFLDEVRYLKIRHASRALRGWFRTDPARVRIASDLLIEIGQEDPEAVRPHVPIAIQRLKELLDDSDWMEAWDRPASARKEIQSQISRLEKL